MSAASSSPTRHTTALSSESTFGCWTSSVPSSYGPSADEGCRRRKSPLENKMIEEQFEIPPRNGTADAILVRPDSAEPPRVSSILTDGLGSAPHSRNQSKRNRRAGVRRLTPKHLLPRRSAGLRPRAGLSSERTSTGFAAQTPFSPDAIGAPTAQNTSIFSPSTRGWSAADRSESWDSALPVNSRSALPPRVLTELALRPRSMAEDCHRTPPRAHTSSCRL